MHHRLHESASLCALDSADATAKDQNEPSKHDGSSPYPSLTTIGPQKQAVPTQEEKQLPDRIADGQEPAPKPVADLDSSRDKAAVANVPPAKEASTEFLPPSAGLVAPADSAAEKPAPAEPAPAVAAKPGDEPPLLAALRCCLDKRPADAVGRLAGYEKTNQELLLCVLSLAARLTEGRLQPQDIAVLLEELNSMMVALRSQATLTIEKLCFCRRILTFGIYDPWPADHCFRPGQYVYIYAEVRNFATRKVDYGPAQTRHVVELASSAEIEDYAGHKVWPEEIVFHRQKPDESRTPRLDYFDNYHFVVPDLPPGAYKLWIQIEDLGTRPPRRARRSLDFYVTNLSAHAS
jgi:hypothetical protein